MQMRKVWRAVCHHGRLESCERRAQVPYRLLKSFHRIQSRLVRELEKKFSGKDVVLIANRRIMAPPTSGISNARPRSRTLSAVRAPGSRLRKVAGRTLLSPTWNQLPSAWLSPTLLQFAKHADSVTRMGWKLWRSQKPSANKGKMAVVARQAFIHNLLMFAGARGYPG